MAMLSRVQTNKCNSGTYIQIANGLEGREDKTGGFVFVVYSDQVKLLSLLESLMAL